MSTFSPKITYYFFGRFAPYLERLCLRFATPWVSRVPRIPEQEAAQEAYADAYTAAQKEATAKLNLWALYDAAKNAEGKAKASAEKAYVKAAAKLDAQIAKILKAKK